MLKVRDVRIGQPSSWPGVAVLETEAAVTKLRPRYDVKADDLITESRVARIGSDPDVSTLVVCCTASQD